MPEHTQKPYNLLREQWLPVQRKSGKEEFIAPHEITSQLEDDPIITIRTPRPDLDAAALQFLIALLQTTIAPEDGDQWHDLHETPPSPATLHAAFETIIGAFNLNGDGPRFMQPMEDIGGSVCPITDLWINSPGDNTRKKNSDFFIKRTEEPMSPAAAALSLFSMQTNAYGGGPGYRTSVRGGGPLTTLVLGDTLWDTLWNNVLLAEEVSGKASGVDAAIFPWCGPTRQSNAKKGGVDTRPEDVHLLQVYWSMPWLIKLQENPYTDLGQCGLYTTHSARYQTFEKSNYGTNYIGPWKHPLTPYRYQTKAKQLEFISQKGSSRSLRYSNWPSLSCRQSKHNEEEAKGEVIAANVGHFYLRQSELSHGERKPFQMFVFGYEMDNAKTLQWNQGKVPIWIFDDKEAHELFINHAQSLIDTAARYEDIFYHSARKLLGGKVTGKDAKGNATWDLKGDNVPDRSSSIVQGPMQALWDDTESRYYDTLSTLKALLDADEDPSQETILEIYLTWRTYLRDIITSYFDVLAPSDLAHAQDVRAATFARKELQRQSNPRGKSWGKYTTV